MTGRRGLFVGLCVLDVIQAVERVPGVDEKVTALRQRVAAGGPATNAAATFAALGGDAVLVTGVGRHPLADGIRADLAGVGGGAGSLRLVDAEAGRTSPPSVSSVWVTASTGARAVVSTNAVGSAVTAPPDLADLVRETGVVLVDGHHMEVARCAARQARDSGRRVVLDGGSWKDGTDALLRDVDIAVCSAAFRPPGGDGDVVAYLLDRGVRFAAVSRGGLSILWGARGASGPVFRGEVAIPTGVRVVDTSGAGDVLHGALAYAVAGWPGERNGDHEPFVAALSFAAGIAGRSCEAFGTRDWMQA
ncbi:PfkB family carbohydrate kinase [Embleya hyalina]|uniref:Kinase n=1 Tax=Embleya hyalina TaxID=516124 RepID=A0A401Z196_9ACTN|nr:PfkB family carbohydrate kinase [Embleya hyalina]GCE00607.1 kinase [Embleya hyalina]